MTLVLCGSLCVVFRPWVVLVILCKDIVMTAAVMCFIGVEPRVGRRPLTNGEHEVVGFSVDSFFGSALGERLLDHFRCHV